MEHIGIDLGSRDSQVCVRNSAGEIVDEARRPTRDLGPWLATRRPARIILETCTEAFRVAGLARCTGMMSAWSRRRWSGRSGSGSAGSRMTSATLER